MKRALVLGAVWPEPGSSAAGAHMMQLLRPLVADGWDITYASTANDSEYSADLPAMGISVMGATVNDSRFDERLRSMKPDLVIFDRFFLEEQFGWRVEEECPDALRVLNCEDLHCLRDAREQAHRAHRTLEESDLRGKLARREIASILRSDLTLIISEYELDLLTSQFGIDSGLLHYVPFMLDSVTPSAIEALPGFAARRDFFTVGNFRHAPNSDGVQWLKSEIWPLIRKRMPQGRLKIAGAYASAEQTALNDPHNGFFVEGRIHDADQHLQHARVCLAPLRFGAGLKGKLVDAMRNGTPSVTTGIGSEAVPGKIPWPGEVAESPESIADAALRLYNNEQDWKRAQVRGFEILEKRFHRREHEPQLIARLELARKSLTERREKNFMGAMLRDHHHRSTKHLSLWIEAKNRLAAREANA